MDDLVIPIFQAETHLSLFKAVPVGDIDITQWYKKYLLETKRAALTKAGFKPNEITMDLRDFSLEIYTSAQRMILQEKDLKAFERANILPEGIQDLGKNVAYTANSYLWKGKDPDGNAPTTQYNWLLDPSTGNGTAARPLMCQDAATGGDWSTVTNMFNDIAALLASLVKKGFKKENAVIFYPKAVEEVFSTTLNTYTERPVRDYILQTQGIAGLVAVDDDFLVTDDLSTAPTTNDFDIVAVDMGSIDIGYTRPERTRIVDDQVNRTTLFEAEVWFCPCPLPRRINESGTIKTYKGVARTHAIDWKD